MAKSGYTLIGISKYLVCLCFCLYQSEAVSNSLHNQFNAIDGPRLGDGLCDDKAFRCHSGKCIPYLWVCDGEPDCPNDNTDELPQVCNGTCPLNEFKCKTGPCIPKKWVCDKDPQCKDGSDEDEELCENHNSCEGLFQCDIGVCIPKGWQCDTKVDCPNGLDEMNCHKTCSSTEFTCGNGACIEKKYVCDGEYDCLDRKDEKDCGPLVCVSNDFKCPSDEKCISRSWLCDGYDDCPDGADEKGCLYADNIRHPEQCNDPSHWLCADKSNCVHKAHLCDGQEDCKDGSDEKADVCNNLTCRADQYQCKNRQCIAGKKQCDGEIDCYDNSDEENCNNRKTCQEGEFDCGDGNCIAQANVCDGNFDCPGHEDEPKGVCHVDECLQNNGGCNQGCVNDPIGHHCTCRTGYSLLNNSTCGDIDECQVYGVCSHTCINTLGSFKCECYEGYFKEPSDPTFCKAAHGAGSLIFSKRSDIRKLTLDGNELTSVVQNTKVAGAMDFVYKTGTVFWMETYNRTNLTYSILYKAPIDAGFHKTIVIDEGISGSDGIAIDWIYDHVYWTDTVKNTIEVADFDGGLRKTLIKTGMDEPRSLAVNPHEGWLFWSDWGSARRIERAGMDGSHRSAIISHGVQWPNGITLDLVKQRIYWVDAGLHFIASANYDGSGRRTILHSMDHLYQPYSLTIFEDTVYWADWGKQAIFKANKFNGSGIHAMVTTVGHDPMIVHVYHPYKQQKGINYCIAKENFCSHMCFPAPKIDDRSPKISCSCPDGMRLEKDSTMCVPDVPSTPPPVTRVSQNTINVHETIVDIEVEPEDSTGYITVIFTIVASILTTIFAVLLWSLYRHYIHKNTVSMNFENLIYKKTTTAEVQPVRKKYGGYSPPPATLETADESRLPLNTISQSTDQV